MKISLGSWAFSFGPWASNPVPLDAIVKRLSEAGCDGIEVCGFPPHVTLESYATKQSRFALAADAGVRLVWEFEPGFELNKPDQVIRMHQEVRHPNFSIVFDTAHAYMCAVAGARQQGRRDVLPGGVAEFLDKLQGRIGAIHLIDSDGTLHRDETSTHRPFGEGLIDFEKLTPKLLAVPNIEWWTIDLSFCAGSWELIEPSRAFVAGLLS